MSSFLVPQEKIENIDEAINSLKIVKDIEEELKKNPLDDTVTDEEFGEIQERLNEEHEIFASEIMNGYSGLYMYKYTQDGDKITIKYKAEYPLRECDVTITDTEVETDFLSGKWYGTVQNYDYKIDGSNITIELQVSGTWPVLICGGSIDNNTAYILACFCASKGMASISNKLLKYSANRYNTKAMFTLAGTYSEKDPEMSLYWIAMTHQVNFNIQLQFLASLLLIRFGGEETRIAENILVRLAAKEFPDAYFYLGFIHMSSKDGFNASDKLAIDYLTYAACELGHLKALETLGKCYLNGICCKKDENRGKQLLELAGKAATQILASNASPNEEKKDDEKKEKKDDEKHEKKDNEKKGEKISVQDIIISTSIIGAVVGGGILIFKHFMNKKK